MKTNYEIPKLPLLILCVIIITLSTFSCKEEAQIIESIVLPDVTTEVTVTNITGTTATGGGKVENDKGETVTARGLCWSTNINPTIKDSFIVVGKGIGSCYGSLTNLTPNTNYYLRAYASNSKGTAYGSAVSFVTKKFATIATATISSIDLTMAIGGGNLLDDGDQSIKTIGVCWSTKENPTITDNKTTSNPSIRIYTSSITGLAANTTYYVRAYATNDAGTAYGENVSFKTLATFTDIDGNLYHAVTIGTQTWMVENLRATKNYDGTPIPNQIGPNTYSAGYCWYNNNISNKNTYGALYNSFAAKRVAPMGWHLPSKDEWTTLANYLGGLDIAGGKLKESGLVHWFSPNTSATNEFGFSALPGGEKGGAGSDGSFVGLGYSGSWWTETFGLNGSVFKISMSNNHSKIHQQETSDRGGCSVRCIKD